MVMVIIGVDPRKASHTAVAISAAEEPLGQLRVRASAVQAERLVVWAQAWPERAWRWKALAGPVICWPSSCWQPVSGCWTCRPGWPPGCGYWPLETSAR